MKSNLGLLGEGVGCFGSVLVDKGILAEQIADE